MPNPNSQNPTVDDVLTARVYIPTLVAKCAELGVHLNSNEDLQYAMQIAERVRTHKEANHIPQGLPRPPSLLKEAALGLAEATGGQPERAGLVDAYLNDPVVKQALAVAAAPEPAT